MFLNNINSRQKLKFKKFKHLNDKILVFKTSLVGLTNEPRVNHTLNKTRMLSRKAGKPANQHADIYRRHRLRSCTEITEIYVLKSNYLT